MRLLRKAMRSEAIARAADEDQPIEPRTSQLFGVRRRRRSSAIERRVRPVRKHSSVEKTGHYGRDAPPLPTAVRRGPSKDDNDDASEWSSSCMEVDMVFGESASFVCIGCSNIIVFFLAAAAAAVVFASAGAAPV